MRKRCAISAVVGALSLSTTAHGAFAHGRLEAGILYEMNYARTRPADYARDLQRAAAQGGEAASSEIGGEDPKAMAEAIQFLERQAPLPPLAESEALDAAARAHTQAQGPTGQLGHTSPDGATLGARLQANGVWAGLAAENIAYGYEDPREVVRQLIVDSGVPNRGHRQNIFGARYQKAGVSCGPHREFGAMCVIDFAGAVVQR
jgi:uncharacterized protein YkwD